MKPVLLTGAAGNLGRMLAPALAAQGWALRLTDIAPFPDALPPGASFTRAEVGHIVSADPVEERYQGGGYTSAEYSRAAPSPRDAFALD